MLGRRAIVYAIGALLVVAGVVAGLVLAVKKGDEPKAPVVLAETSSATSPASTFAMPTAPATATSEAALAVPADADPDAFDRFAAREVIEAALDKKDVAALPAIEQTDLTRDGYVAAAAIDAVGKLAAMAPEPAKGDAVKTLARWLEQESKRATPDATGNVSILVESLGDTKSRDAIAPLVAALDAGTQPLEVQTSILASLDGLDARSESASVERFVARVSGLTPADDLQRELANEALAAGRALLAKWRTPP